MESDCVNTASKENKYHIEINDEMMPESVDEYQSEALSINVHEFDCPLCFQLLYEPITLECGHTFCRDCCYQAFQRKKHCPICRKHSQIHVLSHTSNVLLSTLLQKYNSTAYKTRSKQIQSIKSVRRPRYPIFVSRVPEYPYCKLSLHIFEAKYRIMVHRIMNSDSKFIISHMVSQTPHSIGTLCQMNNCSTIQDGRSLIEIYIIKRVTLVNVQLENDSFGLVSAEIEDYLDTDTTQSTSSTIMDSLLVSVDELIRSNKERYYESIGDPPQDVAQFSLWIGGALSRCLSQSGAINAEITHLQLQILESRNVTERLKLAQHLVMVATQCLQRKSKVQFWIIVCIIGVAVIYNLFN